MEDNVNNPLTVNQGNENLCGPAAIVYELVKRNPLRYVQIVEQCYESGKFQGGPFGWIKNSNSGLYSEKFAWNIRPADWIVMAVMRNAQNGYFHYNSGDNFSAITTWDDMQTWSQWILGFGDTAWNQCTLLPLFGWPWNYVTAGSGLTMADANYRAGGVSFLLVNKASVEDPATYHSGRFPTTGSSTRETSPPTAAGSASTPTRGEPSTTTLTTPTGSRSTSCCGVSCGAPTSWP